jgi:hypothetical protein
MVRKQKQGFDLKMLRMDTWRRGARLSQLMSTPQREESALRNLQAMILSSVTTQCLLLIRVRRKLGATAAGRGRARREQACYWS